MSSRRSSFKMQTPFLQRRLNRLRSIKLAVNEKSVTMARRVANLFDNKRGEVGTNFLSTARSIG